SGRSSRDTANNSTHYAGILLRSFFMLDHLNFFGNLAGGAERAVNDFADFLHMLDLRGGRGRGRRRRRGRDEPRRQLPFRQCLSKDKGQQYQKTHQSKLHQSRNQPCPLLVGLDSASGFHQAVFKHADISNPRGTKRLKHWTPGLLVLLPKSGKISGPILSRELCPSRRGWEVELLLFLSFLNAIPYKPRAWELLRQSTNMYLL